MTRSRWLNSVGALAAGLLMACGLARAQEVEDPALSGMSRETRIAIRYYESGDDLEAMDRFMNVLTQGDPAERSMANEYINLITHRMNTGEKGPPPRRPASLTPNETIVEPARDPAVRQAAAVVAEPDGQRLAAAALPVTAAPPLPRPAPAPAEPAMTSGNKTLMKSEIKARLRATLDEGLAELRRVEGARVLMLSNGEPQAVAIPSPALFQQGIAFHKDAVKILDALTRVVFSLGGAQAVILPEGTAIGDAKVLDMRRTMGISAHLFSAGVAPPRVRVNLLNTQVDIPKAFQDFKGIVVVFVYNQPLGLSAENSLGEEAGPPLSLGLYPTVIRPEKGEGAVIEFSVQDPPAGLVSWRFQLLEPAEGGASDLAPLQEVLGGSPVFHQIYWNGRRNYFGAPLPPGRYEAVLTATDSKNRQRAIHKWVQIEGKPPAPPAQVAKGSPAAAGAAKPAGAGAPAAELPGDKAASAPLIKEIRKPLAAPKAKARTAARRAPKKKAAAAEKTQAEPNPSTEPADGQAEPVAASAQAPSETAAEKPSADTPIAEKPAPKPAAKPKPSSYDLEFNKDTYQLTKDGEKKLVEAAEAAGSSYMAQPLKVQGFAQPAESNAAKLADTRAKMVAGLLINKYQVDPKRVQVASSVSETAAYRVQVSFNKDL